MFAKQDLAGIDGCFIGWQRIFDIAIGRRNAAAHSDDPVAHKVTLMTGSMAVTAHHAPALTHALSHSFTHSLGETTGIDPKTASYHSQTNADGNKCIIHIENS